ncbi:MAG: recombinase family protein, partial [Huintestinicola sp.]
ERLEEIISETVKSIESSADLCSMTNAELKKIVNKITVDKDGKIDVYLNLMDDLGLSEDFRVCTDHT